MVEISIICLIYKSKDLAKAVYDSIYKHTPKLRNGEAEILFVANDPTSEVVDFLKKQNLPHIINVNEHLSNERLFELGFGTPEYMRRVYQGYNQGILAAKGQKIVLINSDNFFSDDWLENLLKYSDYKKVVTSTLIEPGHDQFGVFPGAIQKNFGRTLDDYEDDKFQDFAAKISKTGFTSGGAYMPCLLYRDVAVLAGLYPEGNLAGRTFDDVARYGDEFFYDKLNSFGVKHITAKDSVVYHLKEGEKSEKDSSNIFINDSKYLRSGLDGNMKIIPRDLICYIKPTARHDEIITQLNKKFTAIILHFNNLKELKEQIDIFKYQTNKNIEIVVLYEDSKYVKNKIEGIKYVKYNNDKDVVLYKTLFDVYGEYILVPNVGSLYPDDMFDRISNEDSIYYIGNEIPNDTDITDSINNFIISKSIILGDLIKFLDPYINKGKVLFDISKNDIKYLVNEKISPAVEALPHVPIIYRAVRKIHKKGLIGFTKALIVKIKNRINS